MYLLKSFAVLILLFTIACLPSRPIDVPEDAPWVGGRWKGCFLKIGEREPKGWHMQGWDKKGNQIVDGIWELDGMARARVNTEKIKKFQDQIFYLEDGAKLVRQQ